MTSQSYEKNDLFEKIKQKKSKIVVLGLGQVGLPTAFAFLEAGYVVSGLDTDKCLIDKINSGISPLPEKNFSDILNKHLQKNTFSATTENNVLEAADIIIVCVATPLNETRTSANLTALGIATTTIGEKFSGRKLIIIESTIPPGTMKKYVIPKLENSTGEKSGKQLLISFCPERISPGNALSEFLNNNRIVGAEDMLSSSLTVELLSSITQGNIYQTDTTTAEVSKLAENSYRDINIAFANELALICESHGVDASKVIEMANTHPRVNIHSPGPGVGGPCLPKDPYLLSLDFKNENSLIRTARTINDSMPDHVVELVLKRFTTKELTDNLSVLILGISYKPNVNDARNSPSEKIIQKLREAGIMDITVHDPYSVETFGAKYSSDLEASISNSRCVILATGHSEYLALKPKMFRKNAVILDATRLLGKDEFIEAKLQYVSIG